MLDDAVVLEKLTEHMTVLWSMLMLGIFTLYLAWRLEFFKSFRPSKLPTIKGSEVLFGFGAFILAQVILVPSLMWGLYYLVYGKSLLQGELSSLTTGWLTTLTILGGFASILFVYFLIPEERRKSIFQQVHGTVFYNIGMGILSWFICFPWIIAFSQLVSIIVLVTFRQSTIDQSAVKHLRGLLEHPFLFSLTTVEIVTLVPFTEEFLFRGLLQSWLKGKLNNLTLAITISSFTFALFHFSWSQGITNIELLTTLFVLSCFLGYLYEKQRSLWATVSLHAFFNFISVLMIFKGVE